MASEARPTPRPFAVRPGWPGLWHLWDRFRRDGAEEARQQRLPREALLREGWYGFSIHGTHLLAQARDQTMPTSQRRAGVLAITLAVLISPCLANVPVFAEPWSVTFVEDDWGEIVGKAAASGWASPARPLRSSRNVEARLVFQCEAASPAYIRFVGAVPFLKGRFNSDLDVTDGSIPVRYSSREPNERWWYAHQYRDAMDRIILHSRFYRNVKHRIKAWTTAEGMFTVLVPWEREGNVRFSWDMNGAAESIKKACHTPAP